MQISKKGHRNFDIINSWPPVEPDRCLFRTPSYQPGGAGQPKTNEGNVSAGAAADSDDKAKASETAAAAAEASTAALAAVVMNCMQF